jgi:hypothetical protein
LLHDAPWTVTGLFFNAGVLKARRRGRSSQNDNKPLLQNQSSNRKNKMKLRNFNSALLALAGTTLLTSAAHAAYYQDGGIGQTASAPANDLILSFYDSAVSTDLQVDLGNISTFTGATPTYVPINISADLSHVFGSTYYTNAAISFGIEGTQGHLTGTFPANTLFISDAGSTAFAAGGQNSQASAAGDIGDLYTPDANGGSTAGFNASAAYLPTSDGGSYAKQFAGNNVFQTGLTGTTASFGNVTPPSLNLDELITHSGTSANSKAATGTTSLLNIAGVDESFTIDAAGDVLFGLPSSNAPEPSTYALMLIGALAVLGQIIRRKSSRA